MTDSQTLKNLLEFGLSDKEARVYLASLALGPAVAQAIAAKAGVNRPTAYLMIESLQRRGLMSVMQKAKRRQFVAGSPNHLRYLVAQEKRAVDERGKAVEEIISEMEQVRAHDEGEIEVEILEGMEGTKRVQELALHAKNPIREVCNLATVRKHIPPQFEGDARKQIGARQTVFSVVVESEDQKAVPKPTKHFAKKGRTIEAEIDVIDDTVRFTVYGNKERSLIVHNAEIAATVRTLFDALYDESPILPPGIRTAV